MRKFVLFVGRGRIAKKILEYFPPHRYYIELFVGTGRVAIHNGIRNKPELIVLNDLDPVIYKYHLALWGDYQWQEIEERWLYWVKWWGFWLVRKRPDNLEDYKETIYKIRWQVVDLYYNWTPSKDLDYLFKFPQLHSLKFYKELYKMVQEIKQTSKIEIYNKDAVELLKDCKTFDTPETVIYLDPPYKGKEDHYRYNVNYDEMLEVAESFQNAHIFLSEATQPNKRWVKVADFTTTSWITNSFNTTGRKVDYLFKLDNGGGGG